MDRAFGLERTPSGSVSGQASAELRALLQQRLVMIEGANGPTLEPARGPSAPAVLTTSLPTEMRDDAIQVGSPAAYNNAVPRLAVPMSRCDLQATKQLSARVFPHMANSTGPRNSPPTLPTRPCGAPPPPTARAAPVLSPTAISPKGSRLLEVSADAVQKLKGGDFPEKLNPRQGLYRQGAAAEARTQLFDNLEASDDCGFGDRARLVPVERMQVPRSNALFRGLSASEVDANAMRNRKVSCGKLYEELAYLRKENMFLQKKVQELEQRANEEQNQQLSDELAEAREAHKAADANNAELLGRIKELEQRDPLMCTVDMEKQVNNHLAELKQTQEAENERNKDQLEILMHQNEKLNRELDDLKRERREASLSAEQTHIQQINQLKQQNETLAHERDEARQALEKQGPAPTDEPQVQSKEAAACSQSRLKAVMTDRHATVEQLQQAIAAAEALIGEAKRECAAKLLRERRAAYERLHAAIDSGNEESLVEAIAVARRVEVDSEDIVKGEAKLALLRSLTAEQRAAKALHELVIEKKKEAFLLVKKDDASALQELLEGLEESVQWQDWRDYMGRTLWRFALELRVTRTPAYLAPLLGLQVPGEKKPPVADARPSLAAALRCQPQPAGPTEESPRRASAETPTPDLARSCASTDSGQEKVNVPEHSEAPKLPTPTEAELAELKAKAFRSVVQDNTSGLLEVLQRLEMDVWRQWQNKAGKDLLTLSQERGSSGAYSVLAKALGLVQELKRESFDEREAVWIFAQGEVQPRRATVLEDTPELADEVLVEYWDGDEPATRVERCLVRKMWS